MTMEELDFIDTCEYAMDYGDYLTKDKYERYLELCKKRSEEENLSNENK